MTETASSSSKTPVAHQGEQPVDGEQVAVGEGLGVRPDVGEAHRPPQPADVVDGHVGERGHRVAGVPARAAQQPLLDLPDVDVRRRLVLRRLDHGMSEEVSDVPALAAPRRRLLVRLGQPVDVALHVLDVRHVAQHQLAALAGRLDDQRAAAEDALQQAAVREGHVVDPRDRHVPAGPRDHADPGDDAAVGHDVRRRQPLQERPHHEPRTISTAITSTASRSHFCEPPSGTIVAR